VTKKKVSKDASEFLDSWKLLLVGVGGIVIVYLLREAFHLLGW